MHQVVAVRSIFFRLFLRSFLMYRYIRYCPIFILIYQNWKEKKNVLIFVCGCFVCREMTGCGIFFRPLFWIILTERGGKQNSTLYWIRSHDNLFLWLLFQLFSYINYIYVSRTKTTESTPNTFMPPTSTFFPFSFRYVFLIVILIRRRIRCHTESPKNNIPAATTPKKKKLWLFSLSQSSFFHHAIRTHSYIYIFTVRVFSIN